MKKPFFPVLLGLLMTLFLSSAQAQRASVAVDNFSGAANVSIPLLNMQYGAISVPIALSYNGSGIRVKDVEGTAGIGWSLIAGGQVSRQVRGLPDDVTDISSTGRTGWLHNSNGSKINSFSVSNDNNQSTTTDEATDLTNIASNFYDISDTEPDIFYVNAPGLSCALVFDNDHNIRTIPYKDIKVEYTLETAVPNTWNSYGRINKFKITTPQGFTYTFSALEVTTKTSNSSNPSAIKYFRREYEQYKNGVEYVGAWKLTEIADLASNSVLFGYNERPLATSKDRLAIAEGTSTTTIYPFSYYTWTKQLRLGSISALDLPSVELEYVEAPTSSISMISSIKGLGKTITLNYINATTLGVATYKTFLNSYGVNGKKMLDFEYNGLSGSTIALPDSTSKEIDLWGYYNNSGETTLLPNVYVNPGTTGYERYRNASPGSASAIFPYSIATGALRSVSSSAIINGALKKINYEDNGSTSIVYEPNEYYDPTYGGVMKGGGLRTKQVIDYDGLNTANNQIVDYSYINPSTGTSSGKPISVPLLTFTTPYTSSGTAESQWKSSVVRLEENISQESNAIVYSHVKVAQSGAGSSLFEYKTPATYWDSSASPDWVPTTVNIARPGSAFGGYAINEVNTYPFIPNINYDFERGLLSKVIQYNESGNKVTESAYNYQRSGSPLVINAFKFDDNAAVRSYAKYSIYASVGNLTQTETNTVYDAPSTTQYNQTSTSYTYSGTGHKEPTLVQRTNSDGSISRVYTKYVRDYNASSASDLQTISLYSLQQKGANFPIETFSQIERDGVNKTIAGSLTKLKPWTFPNWGMPAIDLPIQRLAFVSANGLTDFTTSNTSSGTFTNDSRYIVKENILAYDRYGKLVTKDDNNLHVQTTISSLLMSVPIAMFNNASIEEVGYSDFDNYEPEGTFSNNLTNNVSTNKRSGYYSLSITSSNYFTRNIIKSATRKSYVFSIWINSTTNGNITLSLTSGSSATLTYGLPFINTSGTWKYYEIKVPVATMSNTFAVNFQSDSNILIEDVLFYPADAIANTLAYDVKTFLKTIETNTNGVSQYFEYDTLGRVIHVLDQDKNIVLRKSYIRGSDQSAYYASVSSQSTILAGVAANFSDGGGNTNAGVPVTYIWDFGDGTGTIGSSSSIGQISHTYASTGTYTVTLTKSSDLLGTKTATQSITVSTNSTPAVIGGTGPITLSFIQGGSVMYTFSGSDLWNSVASVPPGFYTIQFSTTDNPYNASSNPYGYKKYVYALYTADETGIQLENCFPSASNSHSISFGLNILAGRKYYFSTSTNTCVIEEVD